LARIAAAASKMSRRDSAGPCRTPETRLLEKAVDQQLVVSATAALGRHQRPLSQRSGDRHQHLVRDKAIDPWGRMAGDPLSSFLSHFSRRLACLSHFSPSLAAQAIGQLSVMLVLQDDVLRDGQSQFGREVLQQDPVRFTLQHQQIPAAAEQQIDQRAQTASVGLDLADPGRQFPRCGFVPVKQSPQIGEKITLRSQNNGNWPGA
jgi:hypothetical protein